MRTRLVFTDTPGKYVRVSGPGARDWLKDNGIPAMFSARSHGFHLRRDRYADTLALAQEQHVPVKVKAGEAA